MNGTLNKGMTVGSIVAADFSKAKVFERLGIDYCCHGSDTLATACSKQNLNPDEVLAKLENSNDSAIVANFSCWPLDLLLDYVLKWHHRNFHLHHEDLLRLVIKVEGVHGGRHPELHAVKTAVEESFAELDNHFSKEEHVLFPYLYEMYQAHDEGRQPEPFHCGSIYPPIRQMMLEHDAAGEMWQHIENLTQHFTTPADGCASYKLMNEQLRRFYSDLKEHVAIENNLLFPGFLKMEQQQ